MLLSLGPYLVAFWAPLGCFARLGGQIPQEPLPYGLSLAPYGSSVSAPNVADLLSNCEVGHDAPKLSLNLAASVWRSFWLQCGLHREHANENWSFFGPRVVFFSSVKQYESTEPLLEPHSALVTWGGPVDPCGREVAAPPAAAKESLAAVHLLPCRPPFLALAVSVGSRLAPETARTWFGPGLCGLPVGPC